MQTPPVPPQILAPPPARPARPAGRTLIAIAAAALLGLGVSGCGGEEEEPLAILPITANLEFCPSAGSCTATSPVTADPVVYLEAAGTAGDTASVQVMLRTAASYDIDSINLEITFDPAVAQVVSQFNGAATPFGNCNGPASCDPKCVINCGSVGGAGDCNVTGDLVIGISRSSSPGCASYAAVTGPAGVPILRLGFRAATVGGTSLELVDRPAMTGDCEILHWEPAGSDPPITQHPIPCDDGGAMLTATR